MSPGDLQWLLVDGQSGNFRDLVEIPDDRSVHIYVAVFIGDKNIGL